jgi:flagellar basal-body rod protein FlgF
MMRGLYAAAAGMLSSFTRQETLNNNLANVNTPGFKRDVTPIRAGRELGEVRDIGALFNVPYQTRPLRTLVGTVGTGALNDPVVTDFSDGDVRETGNELDLAIVGPGFFQMQSPDGETFFTRAGQFARDAGGRLVDPAGNFLMGDDGPILVRQGPVSVDPDGTVYSEGEEVAIMRVMTFPTDTPMEKVGDNAFRPTDPSLPPTFANELTSVQQGALEGSNVNPTQAVIEMMSAMRSYEAAQRMVQLNDSIMERSVNDIGRV